MTKLRMLTVGRPKDLRMRGLVEDYLKRMGADFSVQWEQVAEEPVKKGSEQRAVGREEKRLLSRLAPDDFLVLLDISGELIDSSALARRLDGWRAQGKRVVALVGGPLGVGDRIQERADWRWSLSRLTLPHGLAQVVVAEQLYRAWTIVKGHPYHK